MLRGRFSIDKTQWYD